MEEKKINELESFNIVFQQSKLVIFEVRYCRVGSNKNKYFATSADLFCKNKQDYEQFGQCQKSILKGSLLKFYQKYDKFHLADLNKETYEDILNDIKILKKQYNYLERFSDEYFSFNEIKKLSIEKLK